MKTFKIIKFLLIVISISFISLLIQYFNLKEDLIECQTDKGYISGGDILKVETIDSLQNLVNLLNAENYPCQIELNRYRIAYEIFTKRNPNAAIQFEIIFSEETEY